MDVTEVRTWVIFYLLSFVVLLVAIFITTREDDGRRWISLMLTLIVVGVNLYLLILELKRHQDRKAFIRQMSKPAETGKEKDPSGRRW